SHTNPNSPHTTQKSSASGFRCRPKPKPAMSTDEAIRMATAPRRRTTQAAVDPPITCRTRMAEIKAPTWGPVSPASRPRGSRYAHSEPIAAICVRTTANVTRVPADKDGRPDPELVSVVSPGRKAGATSTTAPDSAAITAKPPAHPLLGTTRVARNAATVA